MTFYLVSHNELPQTTRLFVDFLYHFDRVAPFFEYSPHDPKSYAEAAARIEYPEGRRKELVSALERVHPDSESLVRLAQTGTVTVLTGQQVGLCGGPIYTIYKALTAAKLAEQLRAQGISAVPVFWLATEDHDIQEVNHCWVFDTADGPRRIEVRLRAAEGSPAGTSILEENPAPALRAALEGLPFADQVLELVESEFRTGRTLGEAFSGFMQRLLTGYGLLFVDPMQPAVRMLAAPILRQAVQRIPEIMPLVLARNRELADAGYHAQVRVETDSSLLFLLEDGRRIPLKRYTDGYIAGGRRRSIGELQERAGELSPGALLRPVVADYIFPNIAHVAGPAEVAYLAQSQVLHRTFLCRTPVVTPRDSFTILDARSERLMKRYGLHWTDFFPGEEFLYEKIAAYLLPGGVQRELEQTRDCVLERLARFESELRNFDPTLAAALETSRRKIMYQLSKIERKIGRQWMRRNETVRADAARLVNLIYPGKHLQERVYSVIAFIARHGFDLIRHIYENVRLECADHKILVV